MGIFDFFFKKKEPELPPDLGMPEMGTPEDRPSWAPAEETPEAWKPKEPQTIIPSVPDIPAMPSMQQHFAQQPAPVPPMKDYELLSAKLDAIKATLEALNARMAHRERMAEGEQRKGW